MIGGPVPQHRQGPRGHVSAERLQEFQGGLAGGAVVRIELDTALSIEVAPVTRHLRPQLRGTGTDPEPLAFDRPTIAFIGILTEMSFIDIDEGVVTSGR